MWGGSFGLHCSVGGQLAHSLSVQSCPRKDATLQSGGPFKVTLPIFGLGWYRTGMSWVAEALFLFTTLG